MDPFCILPAEMWEYIMDRVEDPITRVNLARTNSCLESFFHSQINSWQLYAILPILAGNLRNYKNLYKTIRNCRLISTGGCRAVDNYIDYHWGKYHCPPSLAAYKHHIRDFDAFRRDMDSHPPHRSLLLSKSLGIAWGRRNNIEAGEFETMIRNYVLKFGKHLKAFLWRCTVRTLEEITRCCHFINDLLILTPNILRLDLYLPIDEATATNHIELLTLPNLRCLRITAQTASTGTCGSWLNLKPYFLQITRLWLDFSIWRDQYNEKGLFTKLKAFRLRFALPLESEERIYKFLDNFDAPQLREFILAAEQKQDMKDVNEFEKSTYFLKNLALFTLKKIRSEVNWDLLEKKVVGGEEFKFCAVTVSG